MSDRRIWLDIPNTYFKLRTVSNENNLNVTNGFIFMCMLRVLLRVRMLYYLKQEVIGNEFQKVFEGVDAR